MSTVPLPAPYAGGPRPTNTATGGAARGAVRRLLLGSGPLKRMSDRIEVLSRLLLVVVLTLAAPMALVVANATATDLRATAQQETATRTQVAAVLLEDAPPGTDGGLGISTWTEGTWTAPDGSTRQGEVLARPGSRAGDSVAVWIDQDGARTGAPLRESDVTAATASTGGGTFLLFAAAAVGAHGLVCWRLNRHRDRRWSADWAVVEPRWSGRLP